MAETLDRWRSVADNADLVQFVNGMFTRLAVHVSGRGEDLTVEHDGRRVRLTAGADDHVCDFGVTIDAPAADRLADEAARPGLGEAERFRIVRALFTSATAATLKKRRFSSPLLRRLTGAEAVIHVRLMSPTDAEPDATHTLIYAARQWIVVEGLHGRARRRYDLSVEQAADYQRRVHAALVQDSLFGWIRFGRWYRAWRRGVSSKPPRE